MTSIANLFAPQPEINQSEPVQPVQKRLSRAEKVWNAVKAYPDRNAFELTDLLDAMPYGSVSSMLSQLDSRNMIYVSGRRNGCRTYSTRMDSFVLLDRVFPPAQEMALPIQMVEPAPAPEVQAEEPKPQVIGNNPNKVILDELTVGEAKELYAKLKEMFA